MNPRILPALAAAFLAAACGGLHPPPRTVPEPERLGEDQRGAYLEALSHVAAGRTEEALSRLGSPASLRPLHVPSHLLLQDARREGGLGDGLPEEYASLAAELGGSVDAEVLRVRVSGMDLEQRVMAYQAAAVRDSTSPWPRVALALARTARAREFEKRGKEKAVEGFAVEGRRLHGEAVAAAERARTEAERAVAIAPDLAAAHACLAHALAVGSSIGAREGEDPLDLRRRALEACGRALAIDPGDPRVLLERGLLLLEARRRSEALIDLTGASLAAPRDRGILALRAHTLEMVGQTEEALDAWERVLVVAPEWAEGWVDAGSASLRVGRLVEALKRYRAADALFEAQGGPRWKARRGIATALAQWGLDEGDEGPFVEALAQVRAYVEEGGPDRPWVERMVYLLSGEGAEDGKGEGGDDPVPPPAAPGSGPGR